jgi:hypothetical protein
VDVFFEVSGDLLALPEGQATILAEKLRLFAAGQFRDEVRKLEKLGTSRAWLAGTREAADLIEMALVDERSGPVRLVRGDVADAVLERHNEEEDPNRTEGTKSPCARGDGLHQP